jgi:hypothetical protein
MKQQQEAALLAAFQRMDCDEREFLIELARMQTQDRQNQRSPLRLVVTTPPAPTKH